MHAFVLCGGRIKRAGFKEQLRRYSFLMAYVAPLMRGLVREEGGHFPTGPRQCEANGSTASPAEVPTPPVGFNLPFIVGLKAM